jgi:serine/threonine-protein kinase SRK2
MHPCREVKLQSELGEGHRNIIAPEEVVLTSHYLGLVMEYAPGGSLTSLITQRFQNCK